MRRIRLHIRGHSIDMHCPRARLSPANDSENILRAPLAELRLQESSILSDLACGDIDERKAWQDLALVRRSILASRGAGILRVS